MSFTPGLKISNRDDGLEIIEENWEKENCFSAIKAKKAPINEFDSPLPEKNQQLNLMSKVSKIRPSSCRVSSHAKELLNSYTQMNKFEPKNTSNFDPA